MPATAGALTSKPVSTPPDPEQQAIRRRWWREGAIVLVLAVIGIVLATVTSGYDALDLVGVGFLSIAGVAGVSFVFYEVGRSEDRDRARGGVGPYDRPREGEPSAPGVHRDDGPGRGLRRPAGAATASGVQHLHYRYGPIDVRPARTRSTSRPASRARRSRATSPASRPTCGAPTARCRRWTSSTCTTPCGSSGSRRDATAPQIPAERFFAAGEEKTILSFPKGYGYYNDASRPLAPQLHAPQPHLDAARRSGSPTTSTSSRRPRPQAKRMKHARPIWMDVQNGELYPVFDVPRGRGDDGEYTYPDDATGPVRRRAREERVDGRPRRRARRHRRPRAPRRPARRPLAAAARRQQRGRRAHSSAPSAHYYEPAGPVSWDVTMSATPDYRVAVKKGDKLAITATYETERASWYEGMGIMVVWMADGRRRRRPVHDRGRRAGRPHARPPARERQPRRRRRGGLPDPLALLAAPSEHRLRDRHQQLRLRPGRHERRSAAACRRRSSAGQSLTFKNLDARSQRHLAHDHRLQGAVRRDDRGSRTRWPTAASSSTPASSASARRDDRRPRTATRGRRRPTCRRAPTRTSAGSTRSCAVRSA